MISKELNSVASFPDSTVDAPRLSQVILKLTQLCNLNCTYCYVYNMGDDSWRQRPKYISDSVIDQLLQRVLEYCQDSGQDFFHFELHGGEPLLYGKRRFNSLLEKIRFRCRALDVTFSVQSNGLLLDSDWVEIFQTHGVNVGISVDGPEAIADQSRVLRNGQGCSAKLYDLLRTLRKKHPSFRPGALCVLSPLMNGQHLVDWFVEQGFHSFDFLLPTGNYVTPPHGVNDPTIFTDILVDAFDHWTSLGHRAPQIRLFEVLISGFLGAEITLDSRGGDLRRLCVIETGGTFTVNDVARYCGGKLANDQANIFDNPLSDYPRIYGLPELHTLSKTCSDCKFRHTCRGGYLPDRFDGKGFDNPTIYCEMYYRLNQHIENFVREQFPSHAWRYSA